MLILDEITTWPDLEFSIYFISISNTQHESQQFYYILHTQFFFSSIFFFFQTL